MILASLNIEGLTTVAIALMVVMLLGKWATKKGEDE